MFSHRYESALGLAARRHDGQRRKGGELPYLTHLVHVGRMLEPYGEDAVIAGLLHDVLEDTCKTAEEIEQLSQSIESSFGRAVIDAVRAVSEQKTSADGKKIPWRPRKETYVEHLAQAPDLAILVSAADKIHNIATLVLELDEKGPTVWQRFRASPEESVWFYRAVSDAIADRIADHPLSRELKKQVEKLASRV